MDCDKGKSIHETKAEGNRVSNMSLSRFLSDLCLIYGATVWKVGSALTLLGRAESTTLQRLNISSLGSYKNTLSIFINNTTCWMRLHVVIHGKLQAPNG